MALTFTPSAGMLAPVPTLTTYGAPVALAGLALSLAPALALIGCSEAASDGSHGTDATPSAGAAGGDGDAGTGGSGGGGSSPGAAGSGGAAGAPEDFSACGPQESFAPTGFFYVVRDCGRWWFVTPHGQRFYSTGVNTVSVAGDHAPATDSHPYGDTVASKYESQSAWAEATATRLQEWGWNTVGAWSSHQLLGVHMPYTAILNLSQSDWQAGTFVDYFAPEWTEGVKALVAKHVPPLADDPNLIGWFIDNEMHWGPDWRSRDELFYDYLRLGPDEPGKQALISLLNPRYAGVRGFNNAWGTDFATWDELAEARELPTSDLSEQAILDKTAFLKSVAHRFFSTTTDAIREADPNHLVLGVRFVSLLTPRDVAEVAGRYLDVVSVNDYEFASDPSAVFDPETYRYLSGKTDVALQEFYDATERPLLITEFGFRAADSGLPNSWPPIYPTLETQTQRADRLEAYAERAFAARHIVGYHWFEFADQPTTGRFDGEDNNWGLVNINDEPYAEVTARSAIVNARPYEACFATFTGCE